MTIDPHSMLATYVLDALDAGERQLFEDHLDSCADCRSEAAGFIATAARLADAQPLTPPAVIRERIMAAVATTPQDRPAVVALTQHRLLRHVVPRVAAAAAVLVAVVGAGAYAGEHDQVHDEHSRNVAITSILAKPDSSTKSQSLKNGGNVRVIYSASAKAVVVATSDLPALKHGRVYELWMIKGDEYTPHGVFDTSSAIVMKGAHKHDRIAITVEPSGGSQRPTTAAIATISV